jgi:drug/metabolite transporter (DMT)-like permease
VLAAGSQIASTVLLMPFLPRLWPPRPPSASTWFYAILLGIGPTALAYILYFRLIAGVGPSRALTVTLLIPVFGCIWGYVFLDESISPRALAGGAIVLAGTALSTGTLTRWRSDPA